jgi:WD40 repeat protein
VAVAVQPVDNTSLQPVGPYQLATYVADSSGNLTTTSTNSNMPTSAVTNSASNSLTGIAISPSGSLLAVAGTGGLQVFHFNGANPITAYTGPLTNDEIDQISWDKNNHLYAISQSKGKLYVFTVSATTYSQASGSPYAITNPGNLVVLSQ